MDRFVIAAIIVVGLVLVLRHFMRGRTPRQGQLPGPISPPTPVPVPDTASSSEVDAPPPSEPQTLSVRLLSFAEAIEELENKVSHPREFVERPEFQAARGLLADPATPFEIVLDYAMGASWPLACIAFAALAERDDRMAALPTVERNLAQLRPWTSFFALEFLASLAERPPLGAVILQSPSWWGSHPFVRGFLREHFQRRAALGDRASFGGQLGRLTVVDVETIAGLLAAIDHPHARLLEAEFVLWRRRSVDRAFLTSIGRLPIVGGESSLLVEHPRLSASLDDAENVLLHDAPRSLLVVGERGAGKSSFVQLLVMRLASRGWTLFEASGAELMAGQSYVGQLEERLRRLIDELAIEKRVVWHVPDFANIVTGGTHKGQSASILDQVMPALGAGRLVVVAEMSPRALARAFQARPSLRGAVELIRLENADEGLAATIAKGVVEHLTINTKLAIAADVVPGALQLARQYLDDDGLPGAAIDLIKDSAQRAVAAGETMLNAAGLLATLSQRTGLPRSILDDRERIDLAGLRAFFTARVIGQAEAVKAVVDRIAMLKAGLIDPVRPIAVFLFAGPTGTGKTELARTLAEFLFGSPERLLRLDMSEFQTAESTRKILGGPDGDGETQSLIQRVRKQPFSVVLLDEFEKANASIWDLFLQVFDSGRLTDALGESADFRHCFIVLTSNLGATVHQGGGFGFTPGDDVFADDQVVRAVRASFRPEFVNRLDKLIVFKPLTRDLMRGILRKELARLGERRGLRERQWAVEWESSAIEFLLDKGFSAAMGARPLKRAIDEHVLAPLAATMVEHRFPEGDQFLFVRSNGKAIEVEFVDPDAENRVADIAALAPAEGAAGIAAMILDPAGSPAEQTLLAAHRRRLETALAGDEWSALKHRLEQRMTDAAFWTSSERHGVLARLEQMHHVREAMATAGALNERMVKRVSRHGQPSRELVARLASQLRLVDRGIVDVLADAPIELALRVEPAMEGGGDAPGSAAWCDRILAMYRSWCRRRHMQVTEASDKRSGGPPLLIVSGFGAHATLSAEAGLHVLDSEVPHAPTRRVVARVRVAALPLIDTVGNRGAQRRPADALAAVPPSSTIVRRYRVAPAPLVRDTLRGWRSGRLDEILQGDFDLLGDLLAAP